MWPFKKHVDEVVLKGKEVAWIDENIFRHLDFPRYNPDSLIGRKGHGIYRQMMLDEQVKAVVKFRRDAITSRDWFFEIKGDGINDTEKEKRIDLAEFVVEQMEKPKLLDALNGVMSSIYNGFSVSEKTFKQIEQDGKTWWGINRIRLKPYDTFFFETDPVGDLIKVVQRIGGEEQIFTSKQWKEGFIHFVNNPDVDEYYGESELRAVYRAWFSKDNVWKWRMIYLERMAGGLRWIQPKEGSRLVEGTAEFTTLQNILQRTQVATSMILPSNVVMNIQFPPTNVDFKAAIVDEDLAIARGLLVPNLLGVTPQGAHGSFSQSETQLEAFLWTLDADTGRLEDSVNDGIFDPLGEINHGDEHTAKLRFKPISETRKMRMIDAWTKLVSGNAVTKSDADEKHIRELLDFPEKSEDVEEPGPIIPPIIPGQEPTGDDVPVNDDDVPEVSDETIAGSNRINIGVFQKAMSRVDFAKIQRDSNGVIERNTSIVGDVMKELMDDITAKISRDNVGTIEVGVEAKLINTLKFDPSLKAKLRKRINAALRQGWKIGTANAEREIVKAEADIFKVNGSIGTHDGSGHHRINFERLQFIQEEFFNIRSFHAAGKMTDDALATVKNILQQSAKLGRTTEEIKKEIARQFAVQGFLNEDDVIEALGAALPGVQKPDARIRTMLRTNTFEAINEARFAFFTDPGLDGFVQALEYTSILDSRTTQVCDHMDGRVFATNDEVWEGSPSWRPPNHFNCRALLIPVTESDGFTPSSFPNVEPQEGFG